MSFQIVHDPFGAEVRMFKASKCHCVTKRRREEAVIAQLLSGHVGSKTLHALTG